MKEALLEAIRICGGQVKLGEKLGLSQSTISSWVQDGKAPLHRLPDIETATNGRITRQMLRPDFFGIAPSDAA
jgi:DNA-binding transcriptional regulator YdaS (Cro superfamily)